MYIVKRKEAAKGSLALAYASIVAESHTIGATVAPSPLCEHIQVFSAVVLTKPSSRLSFCSSAAKDRETSGETKPRICQVPAQFNRTLTHWYFQEPHSMNFAVIILAERCELVLGCSSSRLQSCRTL